MEVSDLETELRNLAIERAKEEGLAERDEDITLVLRIKGKEKHHEGWSTYITKEEWEKVLSLEWKPSVRKVFQALSDRNNEPLTGAQVEDFGVLISGYMAFKDINKVFQGNFLPFYFSPVSKIPEQRRSKEGRYRLFRKPIKSSSK